MKHKKLFITLTVIFSVLLALSIFIMIWFWGDRYDDFKDFRKEVAISGLKDGACPQGITVYKADTVKETNDNGKEIEVIKKQNYFFITAYFKDKASRIYVVGEETGEVGYVSLKNVDGTDHTGHVGGVATNGRFLWVCSGSKILVATDGTRTDDNVAIDLIKAAKENGTLQFTTSFNANCNAAFLYYYDADDKAPSAPNTDDYLYVGEFYRAGNYETSERHYVTTLNGENNKAFAYEYKVSTSSSAVYGLATLSNSNDENGNEAPKIQNIFSIPDKIQGFARTANGIILSQSYGLDNSHIYYHSVEWETLSSSKKDNANCIKYSEIEKEGTKFFEYEGVKTKNGTPYSVNGKTTTDNLYVYYVDSSTMLNDYSIPSMSEGLCTTDGKVYVLFESGAKKYSTFVRQVLTNVYSFIPRKK